MKNQQQATDPILEFQDDDPQSDANDHHFQNHQLSERSESGDEKECHFVGEQSPLNKEAISDKDSLNDLDDMERQLEAEIYKRNGSHCSDQKSSSAAFDKSNGAAFGRNDGNASPDRINLLDDTNEDAMSDTEPPTENNHKLSLGSSTLDKQPSRLPSDGPLSEARCSSGVQEPRDTTRSDNQSLADQAKSSFYLSVHKAGLEGVDKDKVHDIISNASKGSKYYNQEEQKLKEVKEKVDAYMLKVERMRQNPRQFKTIEEEVYKRIATAKLELNVERTWIHVDMDAFYAAVEIRDDPSLADKPLAIGDRNMILTTNYVARKHGVRSGVPGFIGQKLCKDLIFMKANYAKYRAASEEFHSVLRKYDQTLEGVGLDEANLDVTDYLKKSNMETEIGRGFLAEQIRREIKQATKMTASCGIAPNKMLAKICSDIKKPDGQTQLENESAKIANFMDTLLVRKLPGVGKVNEQILAGMGIVKCPDAIRLATHIYINFTVNAFDFMIRACLGIAKNVHEDQGVKKSLNVSETIPVTSNYTDIKKKIEQLCEELAARAQSQKLKGRTLTVEFKNHKFKNKQKSYTNSYFMNEKEKIVQLALSLLDSAWPLDPTRQISIKLLNLKDEHGRTSFSANSVAMQTGGKTKLGGNPKVDQPKAFVKKASNFKCVQLGAPPEVKPSSVLNHPAMFEEPPFCKPINPEEPKPFQAATPYQAATQYQSQQFQQHTQPYQASAASQRSFGGGGNQGGGFRPIQHNQGPQYPQMQPPPAQFNSYQDEADYRRRQQEYMASKFKYQNYLKKKSKEKREQWQEQMAQKQAMPPQGSYRDKFRSGIRTVVEAKQQEKQNAKNEEMRTYRNFYRNNKFHYGRGPPSGRGGSAGAGAGAPAPRGPQATLAKAVDSNQKSLSSFLKK